MTRLEDEMEVANPEEPHLAALLLVDTSQSMESRMDELNAALVTFKADLQQDRLARKRVDLALVAFDSQARTLHDFSRIDDFSPPRLTAQGSTSMGTAIKLGAQLIEERKASYKGQGIDYFRPWLFLITDGAPTDMVEGGGMSDGGPLWNEVISLVHAGEAGGKFAFFAVGVQGADMTILSKIAPPSRPPLPLNRGGFKDLFIWLSKSVKSASSTKPGQQATFEQLGWSSMRT